MSNSTPLGLEPRLGTRGLEERQNENLGKGMRVIEDLGAVHCLLRGKGVNVGR